jgi:hypothetical protein
VQAFDGQSAAVMSAMPVAILLFTIAVIFALSAKVGRRLS